MHGDGLNLRIVPGGSMGRIQSITIDALGTPWLETSPPYSSERLWQTRLQNPWQETVLQALQPGALTTMTLHGWPG